MAKTTLPIHVGLKVCFSLSVCRLCLISPTNPGSVPKFNFYFSRDWDSIDTCLLSFNLFSRILDGWGYRMVCHLWPLPVYLYDTYISHLTCPTVELNIFSPRTLYMYLFPNILNSPVEKRSIQRKTLFLMIYDGNSVMSCLGRKFQCVNCSLNHTQNITLVYTASELISHSPYKTAHTFLRFDNLMRVSTFESLTGRAHPREF